ncbi:hypothetical protein THIOKS13320044 [Thiocapsa sp. KS1]|nr:hypothetical protein THIOKS13320044 [Thiocapsa sp. KS1]
MEPKKGKERNKGTPTYRIHPYPKPSTHFRFDVGGGIIVNGVVLAEAVLRQENLMTIHSRDDIVRLARDLGIEPNSHILGRKDVHPNILCNFLKSVYKDREKVKYFLRLLKESRQGRKGKSSQRNSQ